MNVVSLHIFVNRYSSSSYGLLSRCMKKKKTLSCSFQVMNGKQSFDPKEGYCGAFSFNFFVGGEWKEVVVDDRLPTFKNKLLFLKSGDDNEFWPPLLEKAFAKLNGCYDGLNGGDFPEASSYFGAISESFNIR